MKVGDQRCWPIRQLSWWLSPLTLGLPLTQRLPSTLGLPHTQGPLPTLGLLHSIYQPSQPTYSPRLQASLLVTSFLAICYSLIIFP